MEVSELFWQFPDLARPAPSPGARRIAARLEAHVADFVPRAPRMPFHYTLGISGYEANFAHPDEEFLALALALPRLSPETALKAREFLNYLIEKCVYPLWADAGRPWTKQ